MSFSISENLLYLVFIITHSFIGYNIYRYIVKLKKIMKADGNAGYLSKAWKVIFRHKTLWLYSILFLLYNLSGIKFVKEQWVLGRLFDNELLAAIPMIIYMLALRYILGISIASNIRNLACGRRKHILYSMLESIFYYYPGFLWNRFRAHDIFGDSMADLQIKAVCYAMEEGSYKISQEREKRLNHRLNLYGIRQVAEVPVYLYGFIMLLFNLDLLIIWNWTDPFARIIKGSIAAIMLAGMVADTVAIIYISQLYLWNVKWEKAYGDILAQGKSAPNIETIAFPEVYKTSWRRNRYHEKAEQHI